MEHYNRDVMVQTPLIKIMNSLRVPTCILLLLYIIIEILNKPESLSLAFYMIFNKPHIINFTIICSTCPHTYVWMRLN